MLSLDEARRQIDRAAAGIRLPIETRAVSDALGRTLARDQHAELELPPFNKSAMDGYAILADDHRDSYRVLETVAAGSVPTLPLTPGTAVKVMTGAPVPAGAGRVIKVEDVECCGASIRITRQGQDRHICLRGEDVRPGDLVLSAGTLLGPLGVANLIGCGLRTVDVFRPLRLAIVSTGDEIADDPQTLRPGQIMNTNGPLLAALAVRHGMQVTLRTAVPDRREAIGAVIGTALSAAEIVAVSGGVSVGDFDFVTPALTDAGLNVHFTAVALKPGRPTTFAADDHRLVFGLPGNPVSVYLMFHLFVLYAAARITGSPPPGEITLPLAADFRRRKVERSEYVPCRVTPLGTLERVDFHGSAHLTALNRADGFFVVPLGVSSLSAGTAAQFLRTTF